MAARPASLCRTSAFRRPRVLRADLFYQCAVARAGEAVLAQLLLKLGDVEGLQAALLGRPFGIARKLTLVACRGAANEKGSPEFQATQTRM